MKNNNYRPLDARIVLGRSSTESDDEEEENCDNYSNNSQTANVDQIQENIDNLFDEAQLNPDENETEKKRREMKMLHKSMKSVFSGPENTEMLIIKEDLDEWQARCNAIRCGLIEKVEDQTDHSKIKSPQWIKSEIKRVMNEKYKKKKKFCKINYPKTLIDSANIAQKRKKNPHGKITRSEANVFSEQLAREMGFGIMTDDEYEAKYGKNETSDDDVDIALKDANRKNSRKDAEDEQEVSENKNKEEQEQEKENDDYDYEDDEEDEIVTEDEDSEMKYFKNDQKVKTIENFQINQFKKLKT